MPIAVSVKKAPEKGGDVLWTCCMNTKGKAPNCSACVQCKAFMKRGEAMKQCMKTSCLGDYCNVHLKGRFYEHKTDSEPRIIGLRIAKSGISPDAGLGLFAARDFKFGEHIMKMEYEQITRAQLNARYDYKDTKSGHHVEGVGPYAITVNDKKKPIVDAMCIRNAPSFANDKTMSKGRGTQGANAVFMPTTGNGVWLTTMKNPAGKKQPNAIAIKKGEEIFIAYGKDYWKPPQNIHVQHKRVGVSKLKVANSGRVGKRIVAAKPTKKLTTKKILKTI